MQDSPYVHRQIRSKEWQSIRGVACLLRIFTHLPPVAAEFIQSLLRFSTSNCRCLQRRRVRRIDVAGLRRPVDASPVRKSRVRKSRVLGSGAARLAGSIQVTLNGSKMIQETRAVGVVGVSHHKAPSVLPLNKRLAYRPSNMERASPSSDIGHPFVLLIKPPFSISLEQDGAFCPADIRFVYITVPCFRAQKPPRRSSLHA